MTEPKTPLGTPPLVVPVHGHGRLYRGGVPGNRGGTGRPRNAIRARMRESLEELLPVAVSIIDDENATNADRLRALEFLARWGLRDTDDDTEGGEVTLRIIRDG